MRTAAGALLKKVHAAQGHGSAPSPRPESGRASAIPVVVVVDAVIRQTFIKTFGHKVWWQKSTFLGEMRSLRK